jgi:hypothetical protein
VVSNLLTDRRCLDELGTGTDDGYYFHLLVFLVNVGGIRRESFNPLNSLKSFKSLKAFKTLKGLANGNWQSLMASGVAGHGFGF